MKTLIARLFFVSTLATSALLVGCVNYTTVREHKDLSEISPSIHSVVILPPDIKIQKINFTGENEALTEKENQISLQLTSALAQQLRDKHLTVTDFKFAEETTANPDFAYSVTQCKKAFTETQKNLYAKAVDVKNKNKFSESIGGLGNNIAEITGADAFVVIQYDGFEKSGGMIAKDIAAGVLLGVLTGTVTTSPPTGSAVTVGIIAANSGEVLWTNRAAAPALDASPLSLALKELPVSKWGEAPVLVRAPITSGTETTAAASTSVSMPPAAAAP